MFRVRDSGAQILWHAVDARWVAAAITSAGTRRCCNGTRRKSADKRPVSKACNLSSRTYVIVRLSFIIVNHRLLIIQITFLKKEIIEVLRWNQTIFAPKRQRITQQ
jgi:hypothetical protein